MSRWNRIKKAEVVSFDIFDTLLVRNVHKPEDIFLLVEKISGSRDFVQRRIQAAVNAAKYSENGECTLDDIYHSLVGSTEQERDQLKKLELEVERRQLQANPEILLLYKKCQDLKKRIIAVSDMYLPSSFLTELLQNNGFLVDKVYVSCEYKESKRAGGLFAAVVSEEEKAGKSIIHIGDSIKSDYLKPRQYGIHSMLYKPEHHKTIADRVIYSNRSGAYYTDLGYSVLGPLLWSFSTWLKENSMEMDSIIFLSRDGLIMKRAYEKMFHEKKAYLHVSRQSLNIVSLWMHPEFEELKDNVFLSGRITIRSFLKRLGFNDNCLDYTAYGIDSNKAYTVEEFFLDQDIHAFYDAIKPQVICSSKAQYELFVKYLKPFIIGKRIGIVDIGWKGTMQKKLREILDSVNEYKEVYLHGYYWGIESGHPDVSGFLYQTNQQTRCKTAVDAGFGLLETIVIAREGTTLFYTSDGAILDEYEVKDEGDILRLQEIHDGALHFIDRMQEIYANLYCTIHPKDAFHYYERLVYNPADEDIKYLGDLPFKDIEESKLVTYRGPCYYLRHLKEFRVDYHKAPWKIGFLKGNVAKCIPWGKIYKLIK